MFFLQLVLLFLHCAIAAVNLNDLQRMRSRDLYRLARKFGVDDELPREGSAVEKNEIIAVLTDVINDFNRKKQQEARFFLLKRVAAVVAGIASVVFLWQPLSEMIKALYQRQCNWFFLYFDMIYRAQRSGSILATIGVLLSAVLEVLAYLLQISVLISWVAPVSWRKFLLTSYLPPLSLDPATVLSAGKGSSGWNINITPFIASHVLSRIQRHLARFVGRHMRQQ